MWNIIGIKIENVRKNLQLFIFRFILWNKVQIGPVFSSLRARCIVKGIFSILLTVDYYLCSIAISVLLKVLQNTAGAGSLLMG